MRSDGQLPSPGLYEIRGPDRPHNAAPLPDEAATSASTETPSRTGFVGDQSHLAVESCAKNQVDALEAHISELPNNLDEFTQNILRASEALVLPGDSIIRAMHDLYRDHAFHRLPVIGETDLLSPGHGSTLLCLAVLVVGSLLRHPHNKKTPGPLAFPYYRNAKLLLNLEVEPDNLNRLKAMCLLSSWSMCTPSKVTLDSPWHWNGVSLRLAIQMGLHRRTTYSGRSDTGVSRRVWWTIYGNNVLQAVCFGRPLPIRAEDFDIELPKLEDFQTLNDASLCFIEFSKLVVIMASIVEASIKRRHQSHFDVTDIVTGLQAWVRELNPRFKLQDRGRRLQYSRPGSELHIMYCVCVILFLSLPGNLHQKNVADQGNLLAASCIARLYEEMGHRDDINFLLPIHDYFAMVAGAQLIAALRLPSTQSDRLREDLGIIKDSMLATMSLKWPGAKAVLIRLQYLEQNAASTICPETGSNDVMGHREPERPIQGSHLPNHILQSLLPFSNIFCGVQLPTSNVSVFPSLAGQADHPNPNTFDMVTPWILNDECLDMDAFDCTTWVNFDNLTSLDHI
ncbi:hypothetical protein Z517_02878 [Fonsecaea pedrosoi CBS 271.37]|uniref:Unplaced genomic scaffold supercont1.2, whole genome shotgun sequence n=1 Tax=Fonsecaea pedrosoi CBS 271.37 TaxID=1442368 RepID=A0A0D2FAF6_9EURO|nr:uncharacterized protein Z517_02878 [Fonsecaea pedrosoi CBS 271.37]KIW83632.1 hypothetical protein Z517_02878 [Fonsecaea pedrosoi CBS 271.37]